MFKRVALLTAVIACANASTRESRASQKAAEVETEAVVLSAKEAKASLKEEEAEVKKSLKSAKDSVDKREAEFNLKATKAIGEMVEKGDAVLVEDPRAVSKGTVKKFMLYNEEMKNPVLTRRLAGSPTKSPSSGLHKPTWRPSSKPNEHRNLAGSPTKSPSSGLHKPTWRPSSKPNEHRALKHDFLQTAAILKSPEESLSTDNLELAMEHAANAEMIKEKVDRAAVLDTKPVLADNQAKALADAQAQAETSSKKETTEKKTTSLFATGGKVMKSGYAAGSPTKSPSSGLHKPTWKPSSKPNEHRKLSIRSEKAAALAGKDMGKTSTKEDKIVIKAMKAEIKTDMKMLPEADSKSEKKEIKSAIKADKKAIKEDEKATAQVEELESDVAELEKDLKAKMAAKGLEVKNPKTEEQLAAQQAEVSEAEDKQLKASAKAEKSAEEPKKEMKSSSKASSKKATKSLRRE